MFRNFYDWMTCMLCVMSMACCAVGFWSFRLWFPWIEWEICGSHAHPVWFWGTAAVVLMFFAMPMWFMAERRAAQAKRDGGEAK